MSAFDGLGLLRGLGGLATDPKLQEEKQFQEWYVPMAKKLGINPNPDDPDHHYDYRAFYRDVLKGDAQAPDARGDHFTSQYKTEGHPRTYLTGRDGRVFDTRSATYLDGSPVSNEELDASEQAPDMPFLGPPAKGTPR